MELNSTLQRCGEMYLKFDTNGRPEYGFTFNADQRALTKFYHLQNPSLIDTVSRGIKQIELPIWDVPQTPIIADNQAMLNALRNRQDPITERTLTDYAQGGIRVANGCFQGLHELLLVIPSNYSVKLDEDCFDRHAKIELVLPAEMELKQVLRKSNTKNNSVHENWTLVAHRDFNLTNNLAQSSYEVRDFRPTDARCQFTVTHPAKLQHCAVSPKLTNLKIRPDVSPLLDEHTR
ncbi:MAG: hypothetical protein NC133_00465 [Prevotella sp.]|nr:hypothetical protein [Prevotella sp.]